MSTRQYQIWCLILLVVLGVLAFETNRIAQAKDGLLRISFLDVGQGDAIFIEAPNGNQVLVDGGPDAGVLEKLGRLMPFSDHDLDLVVLTHPHQDHLAGLIKALERFQIGAILDTGVGYPSQDAAAWREARDREGARILEAIAGLTIRLGNEVTLTVLHPFKSLTGTHVRNPNNSSVVLLLRHKDVSVLLTGDLEAAGEQELVDREVALGVDVLKVGHHGSRTSTTSALLHEVTPQVAVISVGAKNRYGHPSSEVLNRLEEFGVPYYRTDTHGTVVIESNGSAFHVMPARN